MCRPFSCATGRKTGWLLPLFFLLSLPGTAQPPDNRLVLAGEDNPWLWAVGKLQVPGQRQHNGRTAHYLEDCSATLVALPGRADADIILTAWHCLELYGDLSRSISFIARTASGEVLERHARRLADGGGMHADWAILRLQTAIPNEQLDALQPHPAAADPERGVTMAGYSRDAGTVEGERVLAFDPDCAITGQEPARGETDCTAFKGASGGAVIQRSGAGEHLVCGIISQGNGTGTSTYVPLSVFRKTLNRYLQ